MSDLIILDGCTFFYSDANGDVEAEEAEGFFYRDIRHLSRWLVRVDDVKLETLMRNGHSASTSSRSSTANADNAPALRLVPRARPEDADVPG